MKVAKKLILGNGLGIALVTLLLPAGVWAGELGTRYNSMQIKLGVFEPVSDLDDTGYDTGINGAISYGRYLTDSIVLETTLDLFAVDGPSKASTNSVIGNYTQDDTIASVASLVTLKYEHHLGPVDLFGGGGIGFYGVVLDSEIKSENHSTFSVDDTDGVFGVHLVAGVNYNINEQFFLGLEGKYRWTDEVELHETESAVPVDYKGDLSGYAFTFNVGFKF